MPSTMDHERHRWGTMSEEQLERRLRKITVPDKLRNFITLAAEMDNHYLLGRARTRALELGLEDLANLTDDVGRSSRHGSPVRREIASRYGTFVDVQPNIEGIHRVISGLMDGLHTPPGAKAPEKEKKVKRVKRVIRV